MEGFSERLRIIRARTGRSQREVAIVAGIRSQRLSQMERGHECNPRLDTAAALARALGISLAELVDPSAGLHAEELALAVALDAYARNKHFGHIKAMRAALEAVR